MTGATGLGAMTRLIGVWNTTGVFVGEDEASLGLWATDTYRWLPGGGFILHEVDARMNGQPSRSLEVFGWDAAAARITSRSYDDQGTASDYACHLDGDGFEIDGEAVRFRGRFEGADLLAGTWSRRDGDDWLEWLRIELRRAS